MGPIEALREAWGWCGLQPSCIVGENDFGNLLVQDCGGAYWRFCPEELTCTVVARNKAELDALSRGQTFLGDWYMSALVDLAYETHGVLAEGRVYCLKIPAPLGGKYEAANLGTIELTELIRASGDIARQIKDLPDGSTVRLAVTE